MLWGRSLSAGALLVPAVRRWTMDAERDDGPEVCDANENL
jgi:hypothetical protein